MTNWQTVSANSISDDQNSVKRMQEAVKKAAFSILLFPVTTGTITGWILRNVADNISQENILSEITKSYLPANDVIATLLLSFVCFGFIAASLSATNSWLLASSQTISWDLSDYNLFKRYEFKVKEIGEGDQKKILNRARLNLVLIGVVVTILVYWASVRWNQFFALQFVMFGAGTSMIPVLVYGLWFCENESDGRKVKHSAFLSVLAGFINAIGIFVWSLITNDTDIVNHIPYTTLFISFFVLMLGIFIQRK